MVSGFEFDLHGKQVQTESLDGIERRRPAAEKFNGDQNSCLAVLTRDDDTRPGGWFLVIF